LRHQKINFLCVKKEEKMIVKAKAKIKEGKLIAKVKYPLVGGAELEVGKESKLKALIKVPFLFKAKFFGFLSSKREKKK